MTKTNNKGFSLVELIIVIAIMAVLVGILAPQFIRYVERSRESTDIQNLESVKSAVEAALADGTYTIPASGTSTLGLVVDATAGTVTILGTGTFTDVTGLALNPTSITLKSSAGKAAGTITYSVSTQGAVTYGPIANLDGK